MPGDGGAVRRVGPNAVVTMPDEIDAMNADEILGVLLSAVTPGVTDVIIDMSGTTFCDSAGVHAVIAAQKQAAAAGIRLRLVATAVLRIFTLIGADQLIPIYPTLEAALAGGPAAPPGPPERADQE